MEALGSFILFIIIFSILFVGKEITKWVGNKLTKIYQYIRK